MAEYWERMGISDEDYLELSEKLARLMTRVARSFTRETHESEDGFFIAFMSALSVSEIEFGNGYYLNFQTSKTNQNGLNAPEKIYGSDFGLRINFLEVPEKSFSKAVIGQAKNQPRREVEGTPSEQGRLTRQCTAMSRVTSHYIVTFRPEADGNIPLVYLGDQENKSYMHEGIRFDKYLLEYILPCLHGETNRNIIKYMISSTHAGWTDFIKIFTINTNLPKPNPTPDPTPEPSPEPTSAPTRRKPTYKR